MSKRIPFDIKYRPQIESGEYRVELRDGTPVRIICWEAKGTFPIIGLFMTDDGCETTTQAHSNGRRSDDKNYESDYDLFIVTPEEEKLTNFEIAVKSWIDVVEDIAIDDIVIDDSWVRNCAKELLSIARKQIEDDLRKEIRDKTDGAELENLVTWNDGYNYGKKIMREEMEKEIEKAYKNVDKIQYQKGQASAFDFIAETVNSLSDLFQEKMSDYARKNFNGDSNSNN